MSEKLRTKRFENSDALFAERGSAWMKLTKQAASDAISRCSENGIAISIVEAGIWHNPGFEARLDAIWHSEFETGAEVDSVAENNALAMQFVATLPASYDTAIISTFGNEV